jgi:uncharacterized phage-associated protein
MNSQEANIEKIIAILLFVLKQSAHQSFDFHKLFKILYFADQKHLVRYGRTIVNDDYIAMDYGPIPSLIYDILKGIRDNKSDSVKYQAYFEVFNKDNVFAKQEPKEEIISESEIECLLESIGENKNLDMSELIEKSHQKAWNETSKNSTISIFDIASEAGANEAILKYIEFNIENEAELI